MTLACTAPSTARRASVLVADGWDMVRHPLALTIRKAGYEAAEAASVEEAMQLLDDATFDVAILDRVIGNLESRDVADKLAAAGIPYFFLTAERRSARDWGWHVASEQLRKPSPPDEIMASVKRLLGSLAEGDSGSPAGGGRQRKPSAASEAARPVRWLARLAGLTRAACSRHSHRPSRPGSIGEV